MKTIFPMSAICFALLTLSGCASLENAGNASYSVKPVQVGANVVCCEVDIKDGKERASLDAHIVKTGDNYDITLSEKGVLAFQGQAIAAGATKDAIDEAAKAAVIAVLAPVMPALIPALGVVITSGTTGALVGGAALGVGANKLLAPAVPVAVPAP